MHPSRIQYYANSITGTLGPEEFNSQIKPRALPPWVGTDAFPLCPSAQEYGYMAGKRLKECSRQELIIRCSRVEIPPIHLVWTPDSPRLVPPTEVAFLFHAVKARARHGYRTEIFTAIVNLLALGILPLVTLHAGAAVRRLLVPNCVLMGVLPIAGGVYGLFTLRGLTAEKIAKAREHIQYAAWVATRRIVLT